MDYFIKLVFCSVLAAVMHQSQGQEHKPERCPNHSIRPVMGVERGHLNGRCVHNENGPPSCAEGLVCCSFGRKRRQGQRQDEGLDGDREGRQERLHGEGKLSRRDGPREGPGDGPREGPGGKGPGEEPGKGPGRGPGKGPGDGPREGQRGMGPGRKGPGGRRGGVCYDPNAVSDVELGVE